VARVGIDPTVATLGLQRGIDATNGHHRPTNGASGEHSTWPQHECSHEGQCASVFLMRREALRLTGIELPSWSSSTVQRSRVDSARMQERRTKCARCTRTNPNGARRACSVERDSLSRYSRPFALNAVYLAEAQNREISLASKMYAVPP